jgi:hypothetical protein
MEEKTYFRDESSSDVTGIVVVGSGDKGVRVTENRNSSWCAPFWMDETEFDISVKKKAERVGKLPDDKYAQVMSMAEQNI